MPPNNKRPSTSASPYSKRARDPFRLNDSSADEDDPRKTGETKTSPFDDSIADANQGIAPITCPSRSSATKIKADPSPKTGDASPFDDSSADEDSEDEPQRVRAIRHRQGYNTQLRNDKIKEIGNSLVREKERERENRLNVTQRHLDRKKKNNQARDAKRHFRPSGKNASVTTKRKLDPYPDWLKWLFRRALIFYLERQRLRDMQGDRMRIHKNALQSLLRSVLQKYEWTEDGTLKDGTVMYRLPQLKKSVSELMEQPPNFLNYWIIKEDVNIPTYPDSYRALIKELKADTLDYLSEVYPGTREEVETALRGTPYPY